MFELKIIESGYIMADGGAMFGAIPKRAWKRKYTSDEQNRCLLAMRCVLAVSEDNRILIDTGMGDKHTDRVSYYKPHSLVNITDKIKEYGYEATNITDVVLTHLHFDHCGYATRKDEHGNIVPSFPNARYWLSRKQWDNYLNPNRLEADSIFADNIQPIYDAGQLRLVETDIKLYEHFHLRLFDGHSAGQLAAYIETGTGIYAFPGDLIPTCSHVPLEWISAYDVCALTSLQEKVRFLSEAEKEGYTLIYCHDATTQMSKVKRLNDNYKAKNI
ncbi:MAG: MBL fold metallo-hydrolase [Prevotella sp.]|jgi:glyoxylase-like metal-dependent hydrolase (beta-lactamase superfamily II)|nr:MBL fold metallo-hydrolase [Prevotella sp.]